MALTDIAIKNAKPKAKPYKLVDEKGLHRWCILPAACCGV